MPRRFNHLIVMARLIPGYFVRRAKNQTEKCKKTFDIVCALCYNIFAACSGQ